MFLILFILQNLFRMKSIWEQALTLLSHFGNCAIQFIVVSSAESTHVSL